MNALQRFGVSISPFLTLQPFLFFLSHYLSFTQADWQFPPTSCLSLSLIPLSYIFSYSSVPLSPRPKDQVMNSFFLVLIKRRCLPGASIRCAGVTEWVFRELFYSPFCCYAVLFSMSVMQVGIYGLLSWNKGAGLYSFGLYLSQIWVWIMVSLNYSKSRPQVLGTLIKYSSGTRLSAARGGRGIVWGAPLGQSPVLSARSLRAALLSCLSLGM